MYATLDRSSALVPMFDNEAFLKRYASTVLIAAAARTLQRTRGRAGVSKPTFRARFLSDLKLETARAFHRHSGLPRSTAAQRERFRRELGVVQQRMLLRAVAVAATIATAISTLTSAIGAAVGSAEGEADHVRSGRAPMRGDRIKRARRRRVRANLLRRGSVVRRRDPASISLRRHVLRTVVPAVRSRLPPMPPGAVDLFVRVFIRQFGRLVQRGSRTPTGPAAAMVLRSAIAAGLTAVAAEYGIIDKAKADVAADAIALTLLAGGKVAELVHAAAGPIAEAERPSNALFGGAA